MANTIALVLTIWLTAAALVGTVAYLGWRLLILVNDMKRAVQALRDSQDQCEKHLRRIQGGR